MKLVDEKKTLAEVTALRKQRKAFAGFEESQKVIDGIRANIAEIKKELDNPEFKSLSEEYHEKATELDSLKAEQDEAFKGLNSNRDALTSARNHQEQTFQELKKLQNDYYASRKAHDEWERNVRRQQAAKKRAEREEYLQAKVKRDMEEELEAARAPAFVDELHSCDVLIRILDPTNSSLEKADVATSQFAAAPQRFVDDSAIQGAKIMRKDEDENYFIGGGGKKKGKKTRQAAATEAPAKAADMGFYYRPDVAEHFEKIGVRQPAGKEEEKKVLDEILAKKQWWKENQERQTQENVAMAQKKLEAGLAGKASAPQPTPASAVAGEPATSNGEPTLEVSAASTGEGVADLYDTLGAAKLND